MPALDLPLLATILPLVPLLYFAIASLMFFLRKLDDPTVTWLLRGLFNVYFLSVSTTCAAATMVFALAGRPLVALGIGLSAACAMLARLWFLRRMDAELRARDAGDADAVRQLRRLHMGVILYNAVQLVAATASIPFVFASVA